MQGIGDDCARVRLREGHELAVTTDLLIEGRHFLPGAEPRALGHKALAVNLSDLAAAGATPRWITLALALPSVEEPWLAGFAQGLYALAERHGVELIGGDTTRGPLAIDITALGEVPVGKALSRAGARAGDEIWVSGELGAASLALVHPELQDAARRLHCPEPRVTLGERLRGVASAAIDVSDGLAGDLAHLLERSCAGAVIHYERVPKAASFGQLDNRRLEAECVLSGGDDYELLFTAARARRPELESISAQLGIALSPIGEIGGKARELVILDAAGQPIALRRGGFDHFA